MKWIPPRLNSISTIFKASLIRLSLIIFNLSLIIFNLSLILFNLSQIENALSRMEFEFFLYFINDYSLRKINLGGIQFDTIYFDLGRIEIKIG